MSVVNGRGCGVAIPVCVLSSLVGGAVGLAQLQPDESLTPVIGRLPQSTALVIVSPRPAHVLDALKGPWKKFGPVVGGLASEAFDGWADFTRELGYRPGEGFDALTSGGVAVVISPPPSHGNGRHGEVKAELKLDGKGLAGDVKALAEEEPHWAVVSVVKAGTAANLRKRLGASPHGVVGGVPVLSVEGGRFALVCRALSDKPDADELLVLAPMDDRGFFESIVGAVEPPKVVEGVAQTPTLSSTPAFALAQRTKADVLIIAADGPDHAHAGVSDWDRGSVIGCTMNEKSWVFEGASASSPGKGRDVGHLPPEASAWFDKWSPGAAVMVVGAGFKELVEAIETSQPGGEPLQPDGPLGPIARIKGAEAAGLYVGPPVAAAAKEGAEQEQATRGMAVWAALRARERRLLDDRELDMVGCDIASRVEKGWRGAFGGEMNEHAQPGVELDPAMFAALPPVAARFATVRMAPGDIFSGNSTGPRPGSVTWVRTHAPGMGGSATDPDWAIMGVEPVGDLNAVGERQRALAAMLSTAPAAPADGKDWVWRGVVRPRAVIRSLPMPMGFAMGVVGLGSVGEVRFETWNEAGEQRTRIVVDWDEKDAKP